MRQHDETVADLYWRLFDEWDRQNPYGLTPQWVCGQEGTFRTFAWLFSAFAMLPDKLTDARGEIKRLTLQLKASESTIASIGDYCRVALSEL